MQNKNKRTGRELFRRNKKGIDFFCKIFRILPNTFLEFLWDLIKPFNQKLFILLRYLILKARVNRCGDNIRIGSNVTIKGWGMLNLGENISIHDNCYIDSGGHIEIGDNVSIAHNSTLMASTHTYDDPSIPIKYNNIIKNGLKIEEDVWIGCGVRVLSNITIKKRSIIAAGAVVNRNIDGYSIYAGVPAKKIKEI